MWPLIPRIVSVPLTGFVRSFKYIEREMLIKTNEGHIKAVSVDDLIEVELAEGEKFYD